MSHKKKFLKNFGILFLLTGYSLHATDLGKLAVEDKYIYSGVVKEIGEEFFINEQTLSEKVLNSTVINENIDPVNGSVISIRGNNFKATEYYEDGIPLYRTSGGYVDLSMYIASNTDIYINSGGSQGLYASSATGGEILLNSRKIKQGFSSSVLSTLSTNDFYANVSSANKTDLWYWKVNLNGIKQNYSRLSDGFEYTTIQQNKKRVNSDKEQYNGSLKIGYNLNNYSNIAFKLSYIKGELGNPIQVYDEPSNPFGTTADYTRLDNKELRSYWFYYDHKNDTFDMSIRAYYDEYSDLWNWYTSPDFSTLLFDESTFNDSRLGMIASIKYDYNKEHKGSFAVQVDRNKHQQVIQNDPVVKNYEEVQSYIAYKHKYQLYNNLVLDGSVKYKYQDLLKAYQFTSNDILYKDNEAVDGQVTIDFKQSKKQSYYLSLARKNRFASLSEAYPFFPWDSANTNVKPEKSDSIELGTSLKVIPDTVVDIATYYNNIDDMIVYQGGTYKNIEEVQLKGFELTLNNFSVEGQYIEVSYAYTDTSDKGSVQTIYVPKSKLLIKDFVELNDKVNLVMNYLYVSKRYDIYNSSRYKLSSYSLVDMQFSYEKSKNLLFKTGVKNLFDKNWEYRYGMPSEGRSFFATIKYDF